MHSRKGLEEHGLLTSLSISLHALALCGGISCSFSLPKHCKQTFHCNILCSGWPLKEPHLLLCDIACTGLKHCGRRFTAPLHLNKLVSLFACLCPPIPLPNTTSMSLLLFTLLLPVPPGLGPLKQRQHNFLILYSLYLSAYMRRRHET